MSSNESTNSEQECHNCQNENDLEQCYDCNNNFCEECINECNYCENYYCISCDELEYISSTGKEEDYENDFDRMFCINCIKKNYSKIAPWDK